MWALCGESALAGLEMAAFLLWRGEGREEERQGGREAGRGRSGITSYAGDSPTLRVPPS